ncbi:hypothetical protein [Desulfosudis oleivorans]|nr:hypothetical protein [Desulfosudis oleivorans]
MLLKRHAIHVVIVALPFLMFHWMAPFVSDLAPGLDYIRYRIWPQAELLFAVRSGTFPLYTHWVMGGMPSVAGVGLAQGYLPFPYVLALLPGYGTGSALQWNLLLDLFILAAAHVAMFRFLRKTGLAGGLAFFISMVTVYSPRILLSFIYGAALHTWAAQILLCSAIGCYYLHATRWKGPLFIIAAAYWVINSGNPPEAYYGMLAATLFVLLLPYAMASHEPGNKVDTLKARMAFWGKTGAFIVTAILLSAAYLLPLYFDMVRKTWFPHQSYEQISYFLETPIGLISNFFLPLRPLFAANFSGTPLYLAVMLVPVLFLLRVKLPKFIAVLWVLVIIIGLHALGPLTPVHRLAWEYLPLASSIRTPTRICMMLPVLFILPLVWLFTTTPSRGNTPLKKQPLFLLAMAAIVLTLLYLLMVPRAVKMSIGETPKINLQHIPSWVEPASTVLGLASLVMAGLYAACRRFKKETVLLLCIAGVLHLGILLRYGPFPASRIEPGDLRTYTELAAEKRQTINAFPNHFYPIGQFIYMDVITQAKNYMVEPFLGKIYRTWTSVNSRDAAYDLLNRGRTPDMVVMENYSEPQTPTATLSSPDLPPDTVNLTYSSCNRLIFRTQAALPCVFATSLAHTGHWRAWVNKKPAPIYRSNGYACAVSIPKGASTVEFRYWSPAAFWGMAISCATLALLGIIAAAFGVKKTGRRVLAGLVAAGALGLFFLWHDSLYSGKNLHTRYEWISPPVHRPQNLAFGKPTQMSSSSRSHTFTHDSACAVDGDTSVASCCLTHFEPNPAWEVDLKCVRKIEEILLHITLQGEYYDKVLPHTPGNTKQIWEKGILVVKKQPELFNGLPLTVAISTDRTDWQATLIHAIDTRAPLHLKLDTPVDARYIRIFASGKSRLCLNEVEVYGAFSAPPACDNNGQRGDGQLKGAAHHVTNGS